MQKFNLTASVIFTGLLLCAASIQVNAEDWSSIIKKPGYEIWVDIDSFNVAEGYPYIVTKTLFTQVQSKLFNQQKIQFLSQVSTQQFNCKTPLYRTKSTLFYAKKNQLKYTENGFTDFRPIEKNSNEFAIGQLVCQVQQMVGGQ